MWNTSKIERMVRCEFGGGGRAATPPPPPAPPDKNAAAENAAQMDFAMNKRRGYQSTILGGRPSGGSSDFAPASKVGNKTLLGQ